MTKETMERGFDVGVGVVKMNTGVLVIVGGMIMGGGFPLVGPGFGRHGLHEVVSVGPIVELLEDMLPSIINYKADIALIVVNVKELS